MRILFRNCVILLIFLVLGSCQQEEFDVKKPDVDLFVKLLKSGKYEQQAGYVLPDFNTRHLERLVRYLGDTSVIHMFPGNPISSKHTNPKILNECLMWTIDGIRFENKYPSLEAILIDATIFSEATGYARLSGKELTEIGQWYKSWYQAYQSNPTADLRKKDLFAHTTYQWN